MANIANKKCHKIQKSKRSTYRVHESGHLIMVCVIFKSERNLKDTDQKSLNKIGTAYNLNNYSHYVPKQKILLLWSRLFVQTSLHYDRSHIQLSKKIKFL